MGHRRGSDLYVCIYVCMYVCIYVCEVFAMLKSGILENCHIHVHINLKLLEQSGHFFKMADLYIYILLVYWKYN